MGYRGSYNGVVNYKINNKRNRKNKKNKFALGIIIFLSIILVGLLMNIFNILGERDISLSSEEMSYYIKACDEISKDKLQVNWQEVAAIDGAMRNGKFASSSKEEVMNIGNKFYKLDSNGKVISVKSFEDVINNLNIDSKEKDNAKEYLKRIKNNVLDERLLSDKKRIDFIDDISKQAFNNYEEYGVLPSITVAQAILESGWGESELTEKHNNLFGIKADDSWNGKKIKMKTSENYADVINDYFRVYKNKSESIKDHSKFLVENKRYRENGVFDTKNYKEQAKALERAGYSTIKDENGNLTYANLLISVIQNNNLMLLDTEAQRD